MKYGQISLLLSQVQAEYDDLLAKNIALENDKKNLETQLHALEEEILSLVQEKEGE